MATPSTYVLMSLLAFGEGSNTWGDTYNDNLEFLEEKLCAVTAITGLVSGTTTLTDTQERAGIITLAGTLSGTINVVFTGRKGTWVVHRLASGAQTVNLKLTASSGVSVVADEVCVIYCDGSDIIKGPTTAAQDLDINGATALTSPATDDKVLVYDLSATANRSITWSDVFKVINSLTAETSVATDDVLALYDTSASTTDKITVANFLKIINALTAETAAAVDDELALYDTSASTTDKITIQNLFKIINSFTEDTSPDKAADFLLSYDTSASDVKKVKPINLETAFPQGHIFGLTLSNNSTDANNDIDIAAGSARDSTNAQNIVLASAITKRLDASWAVGTGNGGLDTGSKAVSTTYHVWLIKRSDTGVVDVLFSTSASSPTMPTNYDYKRRIGSIVTDSSGNIFGFTQIGDDFYWSVGKYDVGAVMTASRQNFALTVPTGIKVKALCRASTVNSTAGSGAVTFTDPDGPDQAISTPTFNYDLINPAAGGNGRGVANIERFTNTSGQIGIRTGNTTSTVEVTVYGWVDTRGRFA